jgi:hypothetical protein
MAIETHVHNGTAYRNLKRWWVNDGSAWRDMKYVYCHDGTDWRLVFKRDWTTISTQAVRDLVVINGVLYITSVYGVFYLDGENLWQIGSKTNSYRMVYFNGYLTVAFSDGVHYWTGTTWTKMGTISSAAALAEVGGTLYTLGYYWDGSSWVSMSSGSNTELRNINGVLYGLSSTWGCFYWSGGVWNQKGSAGYDSRGYDVQYSNGTIYFPNQFDLKYWGATDWSVLGSLANVKSALSVGGDLYVASDGGLYYWTGSSYQRMGKLAGATRLAYLSGVLYCSSSSGLFYWPLELPPNP